MHKKLLFCFTYAGGTKQFFDQIKNCFSYEWEVIAFDYSGHGERRKEALLETIEETAIDLYREVKRIIKENEGADYTLFGYSMGSIIAFEVLKLIKEDGLRLPVKTVLSAHSPDIMVNINDYEDPDEFVKERTVKFGGIPDKLLNNRIFWRTYLPLYKADYYMIARYNFDNRDFECEVPLLAFYSNEDTPLVDMLKWKRYFKGECNFVEYEGKHFFINDYYADMAVKIAEGTDYEL